MEEGIKRILVVANKNATNGHSGEIEESSS